jgi:hypothetical protein
MADPARVLHFNIRNRTERAKAARIPIFQQSGFQNLKLWVTVGR